jgi:acyl transferase domain-containing protein/acyl carrier protein/aryl carrier-like protein
MVAVLNFSVLDTVRRTVGATLRIDPDQIDIDARFDRIGIDSIISMELMTGLARSLGISMTPTQFLNVATVRELSEYIEANFPADAASVPMVADASAARPAPREDADLDTQALLEFIRENYSIDPGQHAFATLDELVEWLVANNQESLLQHYRLSSEPANEGASPASDGKSAPAESSEIAIVGMSCRFPDADDPQRFWQNLIERKNSIRPIPAARWSWEENYAELPRSGRTISRWGALLDAVDSFDAEFFGIPAGDAALIDPQERLLFEEAFKALQDAGVDTAKLAGSRTGVFVGYEYAEYEQRLRTQPQVLQGRPSLTSSSPAYYLANRLSYVFDLRGPSESINVNCASSALSINRACQSLLTRESNLAIAGGVSLNLFADDYIALTQLGLLSATGTCGVFDNDADGYTRGEGVAALVLKRVADAQRDNDRIYAVIKSCHQNNRGRAKSISTIRHESITEVIRDCYAKAAIPCDSVSYIELNGYSKRWGDSFEFEGIRNVFPASAATTKHCAVGSLKGNVGHLEPASGIASVIKVALSLWNRQFPPTITRHKPNEFIDLDNAAHPIFFADAAIPFERLRKDPDTPVRAGVNSFCDSGVNVHILLEEYRTATQPPDSGSSSPCPLFVLSARNRARLEDYIAGFVRFLSRPDSPVALADLLHTLQTRREAMDERLAILAGSRAELLEKLQRIMKVGNARGADFEAHGIYFGSVEQSRANSFIRIVTSDVTREIVRKHLQTRQWQGLAQLWVNGAEVDWREPWQHEKMRPVSLPGYPFARQKHWLEFAQRSTEGAALLAARPVSAPASNDDAASERAAIFHEPPRSELETNLVALWAELLKRAPTEVGIHDNFFELGGQSLVGVQLLSRVRELWAVELPLRVLFAGPTLSALAIAIEDALLAEIEGEPS